MIHLLQSSLSVLRMNNLLALSVLASITIAASIMMHRSAKKSTSTPAESDSSTVPTSVNYHFTRQCNYECGFCFHTSKTSFVLPLEDAKRGIKELHDAGMKKLNFSGGEPFLHAKFLGELVKFSHGLSTADKPLSISIISNGSLIQEKWLVSYAKYLDILAVSCDSFDEEVNRKIGRQAPRKNHLDSLHQVRQWCKDYDVIFKLNTTVNTYNVEENMVDHIKELCPARWKVFQCLRVEGENCGEDDLRDANRFVVDETHFNQFLERHSALSDILVPESNTQMRASYLIADEYMRFLDCSTGAKLPSPSLLDVGVHAAMQGSGFDRQMFVQRGGVYRWSKADLAETKRLEW